MGHEVLPVQVVNSIIIIPDMHGTFLQLQSFCGDTNIHIGPCVLKNVTSPNHSAFAVKAHNYLKFNFSDLRLISAYTVTANKFIHTCSISATIMH